MKDKDDIFLDGALPLEMGFVRERVRQQWENLEQQLAGNALDFTVT